MISRLKKVYTGIKQNKTFVNISVGIPRAVRVNINYLNKSKTFDYKRPIKVLDKRKALLGIGFFNKEQTDINPKLVLNAK